MSDVSRNRPATRDREKKMRQSTKAVGMALISYPLPGYATCSCGQAMAHPRVKVLEDAIDRHLAKKHNGMGIRL